MLRFWSSFSFRYFLQSNTKILTSVAVVVGGLLYLQESQSTISQHAIGTLQQSMSTENEWIRDVHRWSMRISQASREIPSAFRSSKSYVVGWLSNILAPSLSHNNAILTQQDIVDLLLDSEPPHLSAIPTALIQTAISQLEKEPDNVLAFKTLTRIASMSVSEAQRVAVGGLGPVVTELLRQALTRKHTRLSMNNLNRLVVALLENLSTLDALAVDEWIRPMVFLLADSLVANDTVQLLSILSMIHAVVNTNNRKAIQAAKRIPTIWQLLKKLATHSDLQIQTQTAQLIQSLAYGNAAQRTYPSRTVCWHSAVGVKPDVEGEYWQDLLLSWVMIGEDELGCVAGAALMDLALDEDLASLSKKWLSQVLVKLSLLAELLMADSEAFEPWVVPSYMRYVADEILGCTSLTEIPEQFDVLHGNTRPEAVMLDWEEDHSEETAISRGLAILCDFAADSEELCNWLMKMQILQPCRILAQKEPASIKEQQQIARLIAILSRNSEEVTDFVDWLPWLKQRLESSDLFIASNVMRAVIHIQQRQSCRQDHQLSFPDGIHFFNPRSALAENLILSGEMNDGTVADVVFVHGIRGGAFLTWRSEGTSETNSSRNTCWPSRWLTADLPKARLISVHFPAPVSSWEGGSSSVKHTANVLLKKLTESGIGRRPLIFVAHSMGGIIVKEMLLQDMGQSIAEQTLGIVFISTPHSGTWAANVAWGLRHFGACPAPSLNAMKPGPYLTNLDTRMHKWVRSRDLPVLNFSETLWTDVSPLLPRFHVVPPSSAFPGYGEAITLHGFDHVTSCKPKERSSVFYRQTLGFLQKLIEDEATSHPEL